MKKEKIFCLTSVWFCSLMLSAQDTLKNKQLSEIIISATRTEKNVKDVGRSITVISADEIKKSGANSISELLSQQAGIYVVGSGQNPGMTSSVFTRGSNSNQTLILIDGVRITDPSAINNSIDAVELSLANIEKIEIVRGSHSTFYGSSAMGGVINIITKKSSKAGLTADLSLTSGSFGKNTASLSQNIYLNYQLKKGFYFSGELFNTNVNGLNATVDTITNPAVYKHKDMGDGFDKLDWVLKSGFKNEKWDAFISYKKVKQLSDIDKSAYRDDDNYTIDFSRDLITGNLNYKFNEKFKLQYIGGMSNMKRIVLDDSSLVNAQGDFDKSVSRGMYKGAHSTHEAQLNYAIKGLVITAGIGVYDEKMNINTSYLYYNQWGFPPDYVELITSLDTVDPNANIGNVFLNADIGGELFNEKLQMFSLSGGIRSSTHSIFGNNIVYEINPSIKVKDGGLLYATYATGFNAPSLYQMYDPTRYFTWDNQYTTGLARGNKNLKPETSKTFEFGFKQKFGSTTFSAAYFNTIVENTIEYVYLWNKDVSIDSLGNDWARDDFRGDTYLNLGTLTTEGVELGISSSLTEKLSVSANVSLVSGKLNYRPIDIDSADTKNNHVQIYNNGSFVYDKNIEILGLTRRPNTANLTLTYTPIKQISLRTDVRHVGARGDVYYESSLGPYGALGTVSVKQYTLLDVSARINIIKSLTANIRVENLLNKKYYEINGFTTRGRGFYVTLRYNL